MPTLLLHAEPELAEVLVERRLAPLAAMPLARRLKFARLLATWLEHGGSQADLAATLKEHRQTVHYRVGRLQAMFGDQLTDPVRPGGVAAGVALGAAPLGARAP